MTRLAKTAALSIIRHRGSSTVAVATLGFMLTALTVFILLASGLSDAATGLESKADLSAYLSNPTSLQSRNEIVSQVHSRWPSAHIQYLSSRQELRAFKQTSLGKSISSAIEGNPLPPSLHIRTPNPLTLNQISTWLSGRPVVTNVILNRDLTNKLAQLATVVTIAGSVVVLGLGLLALVMIVNTTHLSIEARRQEIEVVRVMGGTQAFVRNPLIAEGVLLGLAGAAVAALAGLGIFLPALKGILAGSSTLAALLPISSGAGFLGPLSFSILLTGAGIGAIGSLVSVRRFARV